MPLETMLAEQAASKAGDIGMGIVLGLYNDARQVKQNRKLSQQQLEFNQKMMDYQYQKQMEMWHATSYGAQKEEMIKAGLNPAMMYGMSGGGGQTVGGGAPNVGGGQGPVGGREIQDIMGIGLQTKLQAAQIENLSAQTERTRAEAEKIKGVDTEEGKTRIESLLQGIDNARMQQQITKLDITLKNIENFEKQASQEDRLDFIEYQTKILNRQLGILSNDKDISDATKADKIKQIKAEAAGAVLRNVLTSAGIENTQADTLLKSQEFKNKIGELEIKWRTLDLEARKTAVQELIGRFNTDPTNTMNITKILDQLFIPLK